MGAFTSRAVRVDWRKSGGVTSQFPVGALAQSCVSRLNRIGPLAQVVEQLAFNQRVAGSSPARLTLIVPITATGMVAFSFVYTFIYT
jgi:hypothetical protein